MGRGEDSSLTTGGLNPRRENYWGSKEQPFWRPGKNPTVDMIIKHREKVLLIRRGHEPHAGSWALPGGFHDSDAPTGEPWQPGKESTLEAAIRELREETGLEDQSFADKMRQVGVFDTFGRDPRDNKEAWSSSTAFLVELEDDMKPQASPGDDAKETAWFTEEELKNLSLAFDHREILRKAGVLR